MSKTLILIYQLVMYFLYIARYGIIKNNLIIMLVWNYDYIFSMEYKLIHTVFFVLFH